MPADRIDRRAFLATAALAASPATAAPPAPLRLGVIADPHHGLAPDALRRLEAFAAAVADAKPDAVVNLGDFVHPPRAVPAAKDFLKVWDQFRGPKYHVIGNHDLDFAAGKKEVLDVWGLAKPFYSFDAGGFYFAVLDCNFIKVDGTYADWAKGSRYENHVHPEQIEWLKEDLAKTDRHTVVLTHQGLDDQWNGGNVPNRADVRAVLAAANKAAGFRKVVACLSGHHHLDALTEIDGIEYLQVNSASYFWVGEKYGRMAPYTDPLFAFLTLDAANGTIAVAGRAGAFESPTPAERKFPQADKVTAAIRDRVIRFPAKPA